MTNPVRSRMLRARFLLVPLAIGSVFGFIAATLGLMPIPRFDVSWSIPVRDAEDYVPSATLEEGEEIVLVYVGSSSCGWFQCPRDAGYIRDLKTHVRTQARASGRGFAAVGIARDAVAAQGIEHLEKFGGFDEVMAGRPQLGKRGRAEIHIWRNGWFGSYAAGRSSHEEARIRDRACVHF